MIPHLPASSTRLGGYSIGDWAWILRIAASSSRRRHSISDGHRSRKGLLAILASYRKLLGEEPGKSELLEKNLPAALPSGAWVCWSGVCVCDCVKVVELLGVEDPEVLIFHFPFLEEEVVLSRVA